MPDKIAVFGGSFNPVHNGHIQVARYALSECALSKVVFLPNANPPHKGKVHMADAIHRYNMVSLAVSGIKDFCVSDYEMKSTAPSYTIDTMRHMHRIYKESQLYFIIGADSLYTLHLWKSYNELIKECSFIVADRNCNEGSGIHSFAQKINEHGGNVKVISMPKIDVTSTSIREKVLNGEDVSEFLPKGVNEYIKRNDLYTIHTEDTQ